MPAGMHIATYLDYGLAFLLLFLSTSAVIIFCYFTYENITHKKFIIKLDEDIIYKL